MKKDKDPQGVFRPAEVTLVIMAVYMAVSKFRFTMLNLVDALTVSAIVLMIVGLSRVVGNSGFFTTAAYGIYKFFEVILTKNYNKKDARFKDRFEYEKAKKNYKNPSLYLVYSAAEFILSFVLSAFV